MERVVVEHVHCTRCGGRMWEAPSGVWCPRCEVRMTVDDLAWLDAPRGLDVDGHVRVLTFEEACRVGLYVHDPDPHMVDVALEPDAALDGASRES